MRAASAFDWLVYIWLGLWLAIYFRTPESGPPTSTGGAPEPESRLPLAMQDFPSCALGHLISAAWGRGVWGGRPRIPPACAVRPSRNVHFTFLQTSV